MNKKVLITLLILLLAGGGIAFAQSGLGNGLLGLDNPPEIEDEDDGHKLRKEVSELARGIGPDVNLPAEALQSENDENEEGERSAVAKAVLGVLGEGVPPEDEEAFGKAVSAQAQEDGRALGQAVSNAARGAIESMGASGR